MHSGHPKDRFDQVRSHGGRIGAHRGERPGMRPLSVLFWAAACAILLTILGILVFNYLSRHGGVPIPVPTLTAGLGALVPGDLTRLLATAA